MSRRKGGEGIPPPERLRAKPSRRLMLEAIAALANRLADRISDDEDRHSDRELVAMAREIERAEREERDWD